MQIAPTMIYYPDNLVWRYRSRRPKEAREKMTVEIPKQQIAEFCRKWGIVEFSLFGSVLRDDFRPDSDVDVLVNFSPNADWSLLDHMAMEEDASAIFSRKVDLISRKAIERLQKLQSLLVPWLAGRELILK